MKKFRKRLVKSSDFSVSKTLAVQKIETERVQKAIKEDRIILHYQPVIRSDSKDFIAFYEALSRIRMPNGTIVPAGQYMPFVENTPVGRILDRKSLEICTQTLADQPDLRLSVNMSLHSMTDLKWLDIFEATAKEVGERLILEITETAAMHDAEMTAAFMRRARKSGCSIAIDDFGTGSTSMRYLRDFLFDIIKIDGMFIRNLHRCSDNQVFVEEMLKISEHFGMFSVAEFVETDKDASMARKLGIDCLQGYLIGKPDDKPYPVDNIISYQSFAAG